MPLACLPAWQSLSTSWVGAWCMDISWSRQMVVRAWWWRVVTPGLWVSLLHGSNILNMCINVMCKSNGTLYPTLYITFVVIYYWTTLLCQKQDPRTKPPLMIVRVMQLICLLVILYIDRVTWEYPDLYTFSVIICHLADTFCIYIHTKMGSPSWN